MDFFNVYGLIFVAVIMIPNIVFAVKCKDGFENKWDNRYVQIAEQISRFGCFGFMFINIPGICFGWSTHGTFTLYLAVNTALAAAYCLIWIMLFKKPGLFRALALSSIPSAMFVFSGMISRSVPLTIFALIFAPCHILISYKNAK